MPEVAFPPVPTRKTNRAFGGGRSVHGRSDLASLIWGEHYAVTIPTCGVPMGASPATAPADDIFGARASRFTPFGLGSTTQIVWSPNIEDEYRRAGRPLSTEIGMQVWGGQCIVTVPAHEMRSTADFVFWTADQVGGERSILVVVDARPTRTEPLELANAPAWRRILASYAPVVEEERVEGARDVYAELRLLTEWTRLPVEQLGEMLGASRRTVYNWFAERPIRDDAQVRILHLRDALAPIANSRDPLLVRDWLVRGDPAPAVLAAKERWAELAERVRAETEPLRPIRHVIASHKIEQPHAESPDVLKAALLAFSAPAARASQRRPDWRPREVTGILADDEEDAE